MVRTVKEATLRKFATTSVATTTTATAAANTTRMSPGAKGVSKESSHGGRSESRALKVTKLSFLPSLYVVVYKI